MKLLTKKYVLSFLLVFCALFTVSASAVAKDITEDTNNERILETIYYEDGSYAEISISEDIDASEDINMIAPLATSKTKVYSKKYVYHNSNGTARWYYTLTGTFTYNGSSSQATSVTVDYGSYTSSWTLKSENHSRSGNKVSGTITYKTATREKTANLSISCSKSGTIS
ncbi:MAG: hypothetical protein ACI4PM_02990 [Butyricicoccus sp.]